MEPIRKQVVRNEADQPVAVLIDYADWLRIEQALAATNGNVRPATNSPPVDLTGYSGKIRLTEDPVEYQRRMRSEWH